MTSTATPTYSTHAPLVPTLSSSSTSVGNLAAALSNAQAAMQKAMKDSENPHFRSKYADLTSVIDACRPALTANKLSFIQRVHDAERGVSVETILLHDSGEWISGGRVFVPVSKADAQGHGSALTYGRRYSLASMLGVAQDDDDGNAAAAAAPKKARAAKPKAEAPVSGGVGAAVLDPLSDRIKALPDEQREHIKDYMRSNGIAWNGITGAQVAKLRDALDIAEAQVSA